MFNLFLNVMYKTDKHFKRKNTEESCVEKILITFLSKGNFIIFILFWESPENQQENPDAIERISKFKSKIYEEENIYFKQVIYNLFLILSL